METKTFIAKLESLQEMLNFIKSFCFSLHLPQALVNQVILAAEEALVNIIKYSYSKNTKGVVYISCDKSNPFGVKIVIKDRGVHFNPIEKKYYPSSFILEKSGKELGGYGLRILRELMDVMDYERSDGENILTLIKYYSN